MKIFHISYFGKKRLVTGIVEAVMNLAKCQRDTGADVKVFIPFDHPFADGKYVVLIQSFLFLAKTIIIERPDIVVFDGMYDKYQIRTSFLLKILKIPYLIVFHGGASKDNEKRNYFKKKIANLLFFNRFVHWANKVVYLSEYEKERSIFRKQAPNDCIIPNGVNIPPEEEMTFIPGKIRILFLSRLDWYGKGLDVLCEAMKLLYDAGYASRIKFNFYGRKESENCEQLFQFGKMSTYYGYVEGKGKAEAYKDADLFILPSRSEGMPVAVLEALSYGLPCILTPETNMAFLVTEHQCGWLVNISSKDIYNTIVKIVDTHFENRKVLYENCRKTAKLFDWNDVASRSIMIYKEVLK